MIKEPYPDALVCELCWPGWKPIGNIGVFEIVYKDGVAMLLMSPAHADDELFTVNNFLSDPLEEYEDAHLEEIEKSDTDEANALFDYFDAYIDNAELTLKEIRSKDLTLSNAHYIYEECLKAGYSREDNGYLEYWLHNQLCKIVSAYLYSLIHKE